MLLNEIIKNPATLPQEHRTLFPEDKPGRFKLIGHGWGSGLYETKVYIDKKHPNQVLKITPIHDKADPYYRFIQTVIEHKDNPFFPKIYGLRVYDMEGHVIPGDAFEGIPDRKVRDHLLLYVWMEKLVPLHKLDDAHVRQLLSNVGIEYEGKLKNDFTLRRQFHNPVDRTQITASSQIPQFEEAMRTLEPLFKLFGNDMHIENIMVRLTGVGPQIVIVDPFFPR